MRFLKIKTKKLKNILKKLPRALAKKAFLAFWVLFLIALLFGGIIFYRYNTLVKKTEIEITEKPLQFEEKTFQEVLKIWREKEQRFKEADLKEYPDLFRVDQEEDLI